MRGISYVFAVSLDGMIESPDGGHEWSMPTHEIHEYFNRLEDCVDTHLYGRTLWEEMRAFWPTADQEASYPDPVREYARIWQSKQHVVFSRTLESVPDGVILRRDVDPEEIRAWKEQPGGNMSLGGAGLARAFIAHDLIDEYELAVYPVLLCGGKPMFPEFGKQLGLRLVQTRTFEGGVVSLRYERTR